MSIEPRALIYNEPVDLEGQLFTDFFFGRYGYGSTPETDDIEHAYFLALDQPIWVRAHDPSSPGLYEDAIASVDRVQLAFSNTSSLEKYRGHGVRIRGQLYPAHTGHHHSPVLLSVEGEPATIDLRNVHVDVTSLGNGTGFLLGNCGLIATAAHVVEDADFISVTRGLYRQIAAVAAVDRTYDLAILRIEPQGALGRLAGSEDVGLAFEAWPDARSEIRFNPGSELARGGQILFRGTGFDVTDELGGLVALSLAQPPRNLMRRGLLVLAEGLLAFALDLGVAERQGQGCGQFTFAILELFGGFALVGADGEDWARLTFSPTEVGLDKVLIENADALFEAGQRFGARISGPVIHLDFKRTVFGKALMTCALLQ